MAMTNCPECYKEISKRADSCPACGHPMKKKRSGGPSKPAGCFLQIISLVPFMVAVMKLSAADYMSAGIWGFIGFVLLGWGGSAAR